MYKYKIKKLINHPVYTMIDIYVHKCSLANNIYRVRITYATFGEINDRRI